jgi:phosphoglycerate kinase
VRADLNLPSNVEDLTRVYAIRDTTLGILGMGLNVTLISHYKRPSSESVNDPKYSLRNVVDSVSSVIGEDVNFVNDVIFDIDPGSITSKVTLLENLRFYDGEAENDRRFAEAIAKFGDVYINDAFSVSHRRHASVCAITEFLPSFAGLSMQREIDGISMITRDVKRPFTAIVGGSKISSKIDVLRNISQTADYLVIAGAMANAFLAAKGIDMKCSITETDQFEAAIKILQESKAEIILPDDVAASPDINAPGNNYDISQIPEGFSGFDIGDKSVAKLIEIIKKSKMLLWNGAVGAFEFANFNKASNEIARLVASRTKANSLISIIGGGETVASIGGFKDSMTFISTAGGAFLEFVAGYKLPGIEALCRTTV